MNTRLPTPLRRLAAIAGGLGLLALGGCASSSVIGLPGGPVAAVEQPAPATGAPVDLASQQADARKVEELAQPEAQAYAAPRPNPAPPLAEGDADLPDGPSEAAVGSGVLPWPTIDRWPADSKENGLLTAEEAEATKQSLQQRAAAQIRQAFEVMSLKRQREAAKDMVSNAAERTKDVLTGIAKRCRTGQPDEACEDLAAEAPAANPAATDVR